MAKSILLLRFSYWSGAIADFWVAYLAMVPERMGSTETVYPMGLASALAFCWGVLLLTADRKPLERRWVLIPTVLVIALLSLARVQFALEGVVDFSIPVIFLGIVLIITALRLSGRQAEPAGGTEGQHPSDF